MPNPIDEDSLYDNLYKLRHNDILIPSHAPLICLVFYIFLNFNNEDHRKDQTIRLFSNCDDSVSLDELLVVLKSDKEAYECYLKSQKALADKEIEMFVPDPEPTATAPKEELWPQVYTASFLLWAESWGEELRKDIVDDNQSNVESYIYGKGSREEEYLTYQSITEDELSIIMKEPLWPLLKAILYVMGYKSENELERIFSFINFKKRGKKLIGYVLDAHKAGNIEFIDFDENAKGNKQILDSKVKPIEFIEWAKTLPLYLPALEQSDYKEDVKKTECIRGEYIPPYIEFMLKAVSVLQASSEKRINKKEIKRWLHDNWPKDLQGKSDNLIDSMATIIRRPEDRKGGNAPWK